MFEKDTHVTYTNEDGTRGEGYVLEYHSNDDVYLVSSKKLEEWGPAVPECTTVKRTAIS